MALDAAAGQNNAPGSTGMKYEPSTVLESDWASLHRELAAIWCNIKLVCNPFLKQDDVTAMLQHWDLWGPLVWPCALQHTLHCSAASAGCDCTSLPQLGPVVCFGSSTNLAKRGCGGLWLVICTNTAFMCETYRPCDHITVYTNP